MPSAYELETIPKDRELDELETLGQKKQNLPLDSARYFIDQVF